MTKKYSHFYVLCLILWLYSKGFLSGVLGVNDTDHQVESGCAGTSSPDIQVKMNQQSVAWDNMHHEQMCS